jgi:hypothetical protein
MCVAPRGALSFSIAGVVPISYTAAELMALLPGLSRRSYMAHPVCALLILAARRKSVWPRLACDTRGDTLGCSALFAAWL